MSVTCLTSRTSASSTPRARYGLSLPWTLNGGPLPDTDGTHRSTVGHSRPLLSHEEEDLLKPSRPKAQGSQSSTERSEVSPSTQLSQPSPSFSSVIRAALPEDLHRPLEVRVLLASAPTIGRDLCLQKQRQMLESLGSLLAGMFNTLDLRTRVYRLLYLKHSLLLYLIHNEPHALGKKDLLNCCRHMFCFDHHEMVSFVERTVFDDCLGLELSYVIHLIVSEFLEEVVRQDPRRGLDFIVGILDESGEEILFKERVKTFSRKYRNLSPQQQAEALSSLCMLASAPLEGILAELFSLSISPKTSMLLYRGKILLEANCELTVDLQRLFQSLFGLDHEGRSSGTKPVSSEPSDGVLTSPPQFQSPMAFSESLLTELSAVDVSVKDSPPVEQAAGGASATVETAATSLMDQVLTNAPPPLSLPDMPVFVPCKQLRKRPMPEADMEMEGSSSDAVFEHISLTRPELSSRKKRRRISFSAPSTSSLRVNDENTAPPPVQAKREDISLVATSNQITGWEENDEFIAHNIDNNNNNHHQHHHHSSSSSTTNNNHNHNHSRSSSDEDRNGSLSMVRRWCVAAQEKNISPAYLASEAGDEEGVRALLECTSDTLQDESENVKKYLADPAELRVNIADPRKKYGRTPLHIAAGKGHTNVVSTLLRHGAIVEAMDTGRYTPLHYAARCGKKEVLEALIEEGANIEAASNETRETPLHFAAAHGGIETVETLIKAKANLDLKNKHECTLLHVAAEYKNAATANLLIARKANMEAKDDRGHTPLHLAALTDDRETTLLLIEHKANITAKNNQGKTPYDLADKIKSLLKLKPHRS